MSDRRVARLLEHIEAMASGELDAEIPLSSAHDELDALAFGINAIVGELRYANKELRRAKERAEAAVRARSTLLRNVSHELRTPIAAIVASSTVLARPDVDDARRRELAERIGRNARALLSLVEELLDLARAETGKLALTPQPFSLTALAADVARSFEQAAEARGLSVSVVGDQSVTALADAARVRQILVNLVGNAIKFTDRGGVTLRVGAAREGMAAIEVSDTGRGLPEHTRASLFAPFHDGDVIPGSDSGGLGIGLALSHRLAQALGGELTLVESAPGRGTTFRLTLVAAATRPPPAPQSTPVSGRALDGVKVLLVDDNDDVREAIADLLALAGARVIQLSDGPAALEYVARARETGAPIDAILMDVRMPDPDGLEVTRRLRAAGVATPIVALTADAAPEHRAECTAAGCDDYLNKPADLADLVAAIARACARVRARSRPASR